MKFKLSTVAALFMVAVVTAGWVAFPTDDHAPDVTFKTLSGEQITTRDLRGRPLLVSFWASNCVSCLREMPHLVELHHELNARGFQIVGVAMDYDPPNRVVETAARFKIPYRVSLDLDADRRSVRRCRWHRCCSARPAFGRGDDGQSHTRER